MVLISLLGGDIRQETLTLELVRLEVERIKELLAHGIVVDAWRRFDKIGIVLLLEAENEAECRELLAALPFGLAGVLDVELIMRVEPYREVYP
jgi:muconolactone delta-isomerase